MQRHLDILSNEGVRPVGEDMAPAFVKAGASRRCSTTLGNNGLMRSVRAEADLQQPATPAGPHGMESGTYPAAMNVEQGIGRAKRVVLNLEVEAEIARRKHVVHTVVLAFEVCLLPMGASEVRVTGDAPAGTG
eukprot:4675835-Prymnesium_polylepis.1